MIEDKEPSRRLDLPGWRALAVGAASAAIGIAALVALHKPTSESRFVVATSEETAPAPATTDPLMAELLRCRSLPAGTDDPACREAWEVNRRRFMGESGSVVPPPAGGR